MSEEAAGSSVSDCYGHSCAQLRPDLATVKISRSGHVEVATPCLGHDELTRAVAWASLADAQTLHIPPQKGCPSLSAPGLEWAFHKDATKIDPAPDASRARHFTGNGQIIGALTLIVGQLTKGSTVGLPDKSTHVSPLANGSNSSRSLNRHLKAPNLILTRGSFMSLLHLLQAPSCRYGATKSDNILGKTLRFYRPN